MPTGAADAATAPDRGPAMVRGWRVFGPGFHKGQLYSPADCRQIAANFARLAGKVTPTVKLGHDREQRLRASSGFPTLGRVTRCVCEPNGTIVLDLDGVPPEIAGKINSGQLNSGSIELKANVADPADPAKKLPGDVLTAVALLGEEQPAVPGFAPPRATYADGAEVPADHSAAGWLTAMADVVRQMAAESRPDPAGERVICFSEMFQQEPPVDKTAIIAAIKALPPDEQAAVLAEAGGAAPAAPAADPNAVMSDDKKPEGEKAPAWFAAFEKKYADDCAETTKRLGAVEKFASEAQGDAAKKEEVQMSDRVDREIKARDLHLKYTPHQLKTAVRPTALALLNSKEFSSEADRTKEFSAYFDGLAAKPVDPLLKSTVADGQGAGDGTLTPFQQTLVNSEAMRRHAPLARTKLAAAAAK